jgi:hypothetical protein
VFDFLVLQVCKTFFFLFFCFFCKKAHYSHKKNEEMKIEKKNDEKFNFIGSHIYLWNKVVCFVLFCLSHKDLLKRCASFHTLGTFRKLSMSKGAPTWFETVWSYNVQAIDHGTIFSVKTKKKIWSWKLYWNLRAFLALLESPQQVRFNKIYFTIFRAKVWKILIFECILLPEFQINYKKLGLEGKISWAFNVLTFRNFQFWKFEKLKKNVFTLGPMEQGTLVLTIMVSLKFNDANCMKGIIPIEAFPTFCADIRALWA